MRVIHLRANPLCAACEAIGILTDCTKYRKGAIDHIIGIRLGGALLHPLNQLVTVGVKLFFGAMRLAAGNTGSTGNPTWYLVHRTKTSTTL